MRRNAEIDYCRQREREGRNAAQCSRESEVAAIYDRLADLYAKRASELEALQNNEGPRLRAVGGPGNEVKGGRWAEAKAVSIYQPEANTAIEYCSYPNPS